MLSELIPYDIYSIIEENANIRDIEEIRMRVNKPIRYLAFGKYTTLFDENSIVVATRSDIDYVLSKATERSLYAYNDRLSSGYITYQGGIRIGIAGEGVENGGRVTTQKNISSLVLRIPHEMKGLATDITDVITDFRCNVLIVAPPGLGKTTFLRDYVRTMSDSGVNVCLIDERGEVASCNKGIAMLDVGANTDILTGINKLDAYRMGIRALSPEVVATDEVFGINEINALNDIIRSGVHVVATVHSDSVDRLRSGEYSRLVTLFDYAITLFRTGNKHCHKVEKL